MVTDLSGPTAEQRHIRPQLQALRRRDIQLLLGYALFSVLVVAVAEWLAFELHMAERFGPGLILVRALAYIAFMVLLWGLVLAANRRQIGHLLAREQAHFQAILRAYESAIALKDPYTGGHGRRVAVYATTIAEAMGLDAAKVEHIQQAGLLHDIGKIGTPDQILSKPSKLSQEEYAQVQQHAEAGATILESIAPLRALAPAVRYHHERYSGCGYPLSLAGEDIPQAARIIGVADALDAMTSARSYRDAISWDGALAELRRGAGRYFDPAVVAVALSEPCQARLSQLHAQES